MTRHAVPAAADRDQQLVLSRKFHCRPDIVDARTAGDQRRRLINHAVPHPASLVELRVAGQYDGALETLRELAGGSAGEGFLRHYRRSGERLLPPILAGSSIRAQHQRSSSKRLTGRPAGTTILHDVLPKSRVSPGNLTFRPRCPASYFPRWRITPSALSRAHHSC